MQGRVSLLRRPNRGRGWLPQPRAWIVGWFACVGLLVVPAAATQVIPTPSITASVSGTTGGNGWYRSSVTVTWTVTDPTGIVSQVGCSPPTVLAAETAGVQVQCQATNSQGGTSSAAITIRIDKTPPDVTAATPDRAPDANTWYNRPVAFSFSGADALSGMQSCTPATYAGPDGEAGAVGGSCRDNAGNVGTRSFSLRYDATPPSVSSVNPERPPDSGGWYNRPLTVRFGGSDSASGIESCASASYGGPDSDNASVSGSCRDRAGNVGSGSFVLRYDSTPPVLGNVAVTSGDGADTLSWTSTAEADTAVVHRRARGAKPAAARMIFRGGGTSFRDTGIENGREYVYSLQSFDQAGNGSAVASIRALPRVLILRKLAYVPSVSDEPILRWARARRSTYYHVQLFRGGRRILGAWPLQAQLPLRSSWSWQGRRYRLAPGTYRWYAWAGVGRRSLSQYRRIGTAAFTVVAAPVPARRNAR